MEGVTEPAAGVREHGDMRGRRVRVFGKCDKHGDVTEKIMVREKTREQK